MNREDVRKLIGGYATGTLTEAERRVLFEAALEDQDLFDELVGEQAFKDLLEVPGARERLLTAVAPAPKRRTQSWWAWGAIAAAAAAGLALFVATRPGTEPAAVEIATVKEAPAAPAASAAPADKKVQPAQQAPRASAVERLQASEEQVTSKDTAANGPPAPAAETALLKTESADVSPAVAPPPVPAPAAARASPAAPAFAKGGAGGGGNRVAVADAGGTITGAVSDPAGAAVAGAPIEARNADTGALYTAASLPTGAFTLPQLPAGNYDMSVAVAGFKKFERQNITLQGTQVLRLDVPLEVGTSAEAVTITGAAGKVNTTASALVAGKAKAAAPFGFTYQRAADSLRITPLAPGLLVVTAAGQTLFPQNSVLSGSNVIVPLPAGTGDVTVVFAASAAAPATPAVRRDAATGTVSQPNPTPTSRLAIIVPALR